MTKQIDSVTTKSFWAIHSRWNGFYCGTWLTKKEAVEQYTRDVGISWKDAKNNGDRAVCVVLKEAKKEGKKRSYTFLSRGKI